MPEPLFERLYQETATMNWQPSEGIRRRGRQRAIRQRAAVVASTVTAVILVAAGVVVLAWRPAAPPIPPGGPTTSVTPPSTPPPKVTSSPVLEDVPESAMLQVADAGITSVHDNPPGAEDWPASWVLGYCPTRVTNLYAYTPTASRQRLFGASADRFVLQRVQAHSPGEAEAALAALRSAVGECPQFDFQGTVTVTILAEGFAGDDSILVEQTTDSGRRLHVIVREGNLLSEILAEPADQATSQALASKAAQRMCAVADSC